MEFYFVIIEQMLQKYLMPVAVEDSTAYHWTIDHDKYVFYNLYKTAGDALNAIKEYGDKINKYCICKARAEYKDVLQQVSNGLNGLNSDPFPVLVSELTWIQN